MSSATRATVFAARGRAAFSILHACQGPAKYVDFPASSSSTEFAVASRNQRSCATRMTPASSVESSCSSHSRLSRLEVVRRLVEQEDVRVTGERPSERGARQFAAGERRERSVEVPIRETQPAHDGRSALPPVIAAGMLEARLCIAVPAHRLGPWSPSGHRFLEAPQLPLGGEVGSSREGILEQRQARARAAAADRGGRRGRPSRRRARRRGLGLAREHPQQRRLARTVRARERDPPTRSSLNDTPSKSGAGDLLAQVRCDQDCHPVKRSAVPASLRAPGRPPPGRPRRASGAPPRYE